MRVKRLIATILIPTVTLAAAQPAGAPPAAAPNIQMTTNDIKAVRQACEPGGKFVEEAPVVTPEKKGMLDCRALYVALGLPIPTAVTADVQAPAPVRQSRMDLDSCLPPDPVGDLMPRGNFGDENFGKLGGEEDEEACRKAADENRGSLLGDLGCMVLRDVFRIGTGAIGTVAAGSAAGATGVLAATGSQVVAGAAGGVAAGTIGGEGLLGVAEWVANKIKPDQSCITTKKSSCASAAIAGIINNLLFNIKGIWELIKLPFKAIGSLFSSSKSVEDSMADKKLEASRASPEEATSFFSDPAAWFHQKVAQIWDAIVHEVTHNYGCREWSGSATLGQMGLGTCVKPWVCFEAASADQVMSAACGVLGFLGGEFISAYLTSGATTLVGKGASMAGKAIKGVAESEHALSGVAKFAVKAGTSVSAAAGKAGEVIGTGIYAVANSIPGRMVLFFNPLNFPGISHYIRWVGKGWEAGGAAAAGAIARMSKAAEAADAAAGVTAESAAAGSGAAAGATANVAGDAGVVEVTVGSQKILVKAESAEKAAATIDDYYKEMSSLNLERMKYSERARKWKYGKWFAEGRADARVARMNEIASKLKADFGVEVDLMHLKAEDSFQQALRELAIKEENVTLRTLNDDLDKKIAKLQAEYDKSLQKLSANGADAEAIKKLQSIEKDIDHAVGQEGIFARFNLARQNPVLESMLGDEEVLKELVLKGSKHEEVIAQELSKFLNSRMRVSNGLRFEVVGKRGGREIQLVDAKTGKAIEGQSFNIRKRLQACPGPWN